MSAASRMEGSRAESRLSNIEKPAQEEGESKSSYLWRLVRHSVRDAINITVEEDKKKAVLIHGIQHQRDIEHGHRITQVLFNINTKEYYAIDGEHVHCYHSDGRKKRVFTPEEKFTHFLYAPHINLYAGWNYKDTRLHLLNSEFDVVSTTPSPGRILTAIYDEQLCEVLTISPGLLTCWVFRYGGRYLLPRKTISDGMSSEDEYSLLVAEQTPSYAQKIYAADGTTVAVFNLYEGRLLHKKTDLHVRPITAMMFFNPLKYLATGAKDGSIKVWDNKWHLQLVFVGHEGAVCHLTLYPFGPMIMSASEDKTIRVWSLETCDEVDQVKTSEPLQGLYTHLNEGRFCSHSHMTTHLWSVRSIHQLHTTIGYATFNMKSTEQPYYPIRVLLMCRDSSVRLVNPRSGDIITTLLMPMKCKLVDASYAIAEEILFAVFANGDIIKASTATNPCRILQTWKSKHENDWCSCLLVYEFVTSDNVSAEVASHIDLLTLAYGGIHTDMPGNKTLLIGGKKDGHICVINCDGGKTDFSIEAHGSKGVLQLAANTTENHLISAGHDNVIKVWRVFPYANESLVLLMSFYCAHTPVYMTSCRHKLAVAFQEHTSAIYSLVVYDLVTKDRYDHSPTDDHMDIITGLTSCPKLKLLASCSRDGTIRIWSDKNVLLREINLNVTPQNIAFCSLRGDLLVSIGKHIHRINYKTYMPSNYRFKMATISFTEHQQEKDDPVPYDEDALSLLSREDMKRLKAARSSFKFTHFVDILTAEESDEVTYEKRIRETEFALLKARENELTLIRDGEMKAKRKPKSTSHTKSEAFQNYMNMFYNIPKIELPDEDRLYAMEMKETLERQKAEQKAASAYKPDITTGFFPPLPKHKSQAVFCDGFIPNSVLIRLLWPEDTLAIQSKLKYSPPNMTEEQLREIAETVKMKSNRRPVKNVGFGKQEPRFFNYDEEEDEVEDDLFEFPSEFMARMQQSMVKSPTPSIATDPGEIQPETRVPKQSGDLLSVEKMAAMKREMKGRRSPPLVMRSPAPALIPRKPKVSELSKDDVMEEEEDEAAAAEEQEVVTRTSSLDVVTSQLPKFITECIGQDWFDKIFPNCNDETMPKPWTVSGFATHLTEALADASYDDKAAILDTLRNLHKQHGLLNLSAIHKAVYGQLKSGSGLRPSDPEWKAFLHSAIDLLQSLGVHDDEFCSELMVQYMNGDRKTGEAVMDAFRKSCLVDPAQSFTQLLNDWEMWDGDSDLREECVGWLKEWKEKYKAHLSESLIHLQAGVKAHKKKKTSEKHKRSASKSKTSKQDIDEFISDQVTASVKAMSRRNTEVLGKLSSIETINYFCEIEMERKQREKYQKVLPPRRERSEKLTRNTVLVLPRTDKCQPLMRLGISHRSRCVAARETTLNTASVKLPEIGRGWMTGFPPVMSLPLNSITLDPFNEVTYQQEPILQVLKMAQKYFLPHQSYVRNAFSAQ